MKRLLLIVGILLPLFLRAQENQSPVDRLFDKYANAAGFKRIDISGKLFTAMKAIPPNMPAFLPTREDELSKQRSDYYKQQFNGLLQRITRICILSVEDKSLNKSVNFYKFWNDEGFFRSNNYEVFMEVTGKDENLHFYGRNAPEGKYSELLMVIGGKDNKVISIRGLIDPTEIRQVMQLFDVDIHKYK